MAAKYLLMEEAANRLGITTEELNERRSKAEISGFRDGKSWKFRESDVEGLAEKIRSGGGDAAEDEYSLDFGLDDSFNEAPTSPPPSPLAPSMDDDLNLDLSLDDDFAASSAPVPPVGKSKPNESDDDLMLSLDDDMDLTLGDDAPAAPSVLAAKTPSSDDDLSLDLDDDISLAEFPSAPPAPPKPTPAKPAAASDEDDLGLELPLDDDLMPAAPHALDPAGDDLIESSGDFDLKLDDEASSEIGGSDELSLNFDDDIGLAEMPGPAPAKSTTPAPAPAAKKPILSLTDEDDDASVLDDEPMSMTTGDSGVSLLDDAGGGGDLMLDDAISSADALSDDLNENELLVSDSDDASSMADSDFQLTPFDDIDADLSDSGSQVIQLDSAEDLGPPSAGDSVEFSSLSQEQTGAAEVAAASAGGAAVAATLPLGMAPVAMVQESRFDTLDILLLGSGSGILVLVGIMMMDLVRNLGTWNGSTGVSSMLLDSVAGMLGLK